MENLSFIFQVMLYVGIGLPLVNLILGAVTSALGGGSGSADLDAGGELDLDLDVDLAGELDLDLGLGEAGFDADLDLGDVGDMGDIELPAKGPGTVGGRGAFVQFNLYCLCLSLVIMGAMGVFALSRPKAMHLPFIVLGAAMAVVAYILLYRLVIYPLRKNDPKALSMNDLTYKHAVVSFRITPDSPGKIITTDAVGATISYMAELDEDICREPRIDEGREVVITEIDRQRNVCKVTLAQHKLLT